jgi:hypothetical protein
MRRLELSTSPRHHIDRYRMLAGRNGGLAGRGCASADSSARPRRLNRQLARAVTPSAVKVALGARLTSLPEVVHGVIEVALVRKPTFRRGRRVRSCTLPGGCLAHRVGILIGQVCPFPGCSLQLCEKLERRSFQYSTKANELTD